jgi:serine/threonine-protein kinase HipA
MGTDIYNVVKAEYAARRLASLAGLNVSPVRMETALGKDVLLVERFDRERLKGGWTRKAFVSALTMFEFDEMMATRTAVSMWSDSHQSGFSQARQKTHQPLVVSPIAGTSRRTQFI